MVSGVSVLGGFAGIDGNEDRDFMTCETILVISEFTDLADNSYNVVTIIDEIVPQFSKGSLWAVMEMGLISMDVEEVSIFGKGAQVNFLRENYSLSEVGLDLCI